MGEVLSFLFYVARVAAFSWFAAAWGCFNNSLPPHPWLLPLAVGSVATFLLGAASVQAERNPASPYAFSARALGIVSTWLCPPLLLALFWINWKVGLACLALVWVVAISKWFMPTMCMITLPLRLLEIRSRP
ncbi:MAG TPA: hypothetical protein PKA27_06955 [Fimbriimonadaceae bacterium]|nr:hypothetical protein [Fimbriimonadaceae bacterium]